MLELVCCTIIVLCWKKKTQKYGLWKVLTLANEDDSYCLLCIGSLSFLFLWILIQFRWRTLSFGCCQNTTVKNAIKKIYIYIYICRCDSKLLIEGLVVQIRAPTLHVLDVSLGKTAKVGMVATDVWVNVWTRGHWGSGKVMEIFYESAVNSLTLFYVSKFKKHLLSKRAIFFDDRRMFIHFLCIQGGASSWVFVLGENPKMVVTCSTALSMIT